MSYSIFSYFSTIIENVHKVIMQGVQKIFLEKLDHRNSLTEPKLIIFAWHLHKQSNDKPWFNI